MVKPFVTEETIKQVSALKAAYEHVLQAVEMLAEEECIVSMPEAAKLIAHTGAELNFLIQELQEELDSLGESGGGSTVKEALATLLGKVSGLWNQARDYRATRGLRDSFTALSLCAAGASALQGFALAASNYELAELMLSHQKRFGSLIEAYSKAIPQVSARDTTALLESL